MAWESCGFCDASGWNPEIGTCPECNGHGFWLDCDRDGCFASVRCDVPEVAHPTPAERMADACATLAVRLVGDGS